MTAVTQRDIADKLGVSVSLVSRALSGKARAIGVVDATIRRVERAAAAMGYVPSAAARTLQGAPSRTLGIVVYDFGDPFFGPILEELQARAHRHGYSMVLVGFEHRHVEARDIDPLFKHALDALIIVGSGSRLGWVKPFVRRGVRVVRIGSGSARDGVATVAVNDRQGLDDLLAHVAALGHRRIGFVGWTGEAHRRRHRHVLAAAARRRLELRPAWTAWAGGLVSAAGEQACRALLRQARADRPTALICSSDAVALGAMRVLREAGLDVPRDISIAGFDDIVAARWAVPALTTVRQPVPDMVRIAFETALRRHDHEGALLLDPELVIRGSTGPAPS